MEELLEKIKDLRYKLRYDTCSTDHAVVVLADAVQQLIVSQRELNDQLTKLSEGVTRIPNLLFILGQRVSACESDLHRVE